jgi:hypothetical protein
MSVLPFKEDEDFRKHNQQAEAHRGPGELRQDWSTEYEIAGRAGGGSCGGTRRI